MTITTQAETLEIGIKSVITISVFISLFNLLLIGLDRFMFLTFPLWYLATMTQPVMAGMIAAGWIVPIVIFSPFYLYAMHMDIHVNTNRHSYIDNIRNIVPISTFCIIASVLCLLHGKIMIQMRKHARNMQQRHHRTSIPERKPLSQKGTKLVILIIATYIMLYLPVVCYRAMMLYDDQPMTYKEVLRLVADQFALANSAVNIIIYAVNVKIFRSAYREMLRSCC
jgi:hypothetical protein